MLKCTYFQEFSALLFVAAYIQRAAGGTFAEREHVLEEQYFRKKVSSPL